MKRRVPTARTVARRLNELELQTLRAVVEQQHAAIERLRGELAWATEAAESWRDDALRMMEDACTDGSCEPGITIGGALVTVPVRAQA